VKGIPLPQPWRKQQNQDKYFRLAKSEGYRARSAYKLKEINDRFHLIRRGSVVLDLGAAPGSWTQVAVELGARVVAVDLSEIEPLDGAQIIRGDITKAETLDEIAMTLPRRADAVVSDVSPATSGNAFVDHMRSIELARASLNAARQFLNGGGAFVVKVFEGEDFDAFVTETKTYFDKVHVVRPDASRRESKEHFVVGLGYKLNRQDAKDAKEKK
jgi:23S rRNA (uridine2552-2'-O)-methyltransferase